MAPLALARPIVPRADSLRGTFRGNERAAYARDGPFDASWRTFRVVAGELPHDRGPRVMSEGDGISHTAPTDFRARHLVALERNEARHMMMLGRAKRCRHRARACSVLDTWWFRRVRDPETE